MFILICRYSRVHAYPGDDVTLSSHMSPETSAVSMEVRWFRDAECIYMYKDGQVSVGPHYEGRASLLDKELSRGNVSLTLKSVSSLDMGIYSCQVLTGHHKVEKSIQLNISGMEPLSPDLRSPDETKPVEKSSMDVEESVLIIELKKLLQQKEEELQNKTRELEAMTEMLKTKSSLLLYTSTDLKNMNKLANQTEEHLKNVLETCKIKLEQLGEKLQEKDVLVEELRVVLQEKDRQLEKEKKKQHSGEHEWRNTEGLKNTAQGTEDPQESLQLLELKNVLLHKEKELEDKTRELESMSGELTRMKKLLQDRERDAQSSGKERDGCMANMSGEMEMCFQELQTLGQKLQEKNTQVEELRVTLQAKERELEEEKKRGAIGVSHIVPNKMYPNPKEQLEEIERWIAKKREERRLQEERETTEALEKEFVDYVSAVEELIGKKHEKILAWAKMMGVLQKKLEVTETDEERRALEAQLKEALEMQQLGENQINQLTESIEEKRSDIEEKHKHQIEEIKEKHTTVSRIQAETNVLKSILPDVLAYFQNAAGAATQKTQNEQKQAAGDGVEIRVENEILETRKIPAEEATEPVKRGSEINNNSVESLVYESASKGGERNGQNHQSDKMVNGVIIKGENKEQQEETEANKHPGKEDTRNAQ